MNRRLFKRFVLILTILSTVYLAIMLMPRNWKKCNLDENGTPVCEYETTIRQQIPLENDSKIDVQDQCTCAINTLPEVPYDFSYTTLRKRVDGIVWRRAQPMMKMSERRLVRKLLSTFHDICQSNNFTYFMISGTLLGSYRHHGILPWDDDVDLLMPVTQYHAVFTAFEKYATTSEGLTVARGPGDRMKVFHRTQGSKVPIKGYQYRWPFLDITFYRENNTHLWQYNGTNRLLRSTVFPLHFRPFETLQLYSPKDAFAVLKQLFKNPDCVTLTYSHKFERGRYSTKFDCRKVENIYPFVHRRASGCCLEETVMLGNKILYIARVREPIHAVSNPFTLKLESSFSFRSIRSITN